MNKALLYLLVFMLIGCTKYEIETIDGNNPPDEVVITTNMKEAYTNRLFITLLGRKAIPAEFSEALALLGEKAPMTARQVLIDSLANKPEYFIQLYDIARADYIESVDTATITDDYDQAVYNVGLTGGGAREYWLDLVKRLGPMVKIPQQLDSNLIDIIEVHRRVINNPYYDDINMGTENFVVATFQNFLFRYPTIQEIEQCSKMVDNSPGSLFFQAGSTKEDFINIFFSSDDYYEGQVVTLYRKYLFRQPSTEEVALKMVQYSQHLDYLILQKDLLASDEYFFN